MRNRTDFFGAYLVLMIAGGILGLLLHILNSLNEDFIRRVFPSLPDWAIPLGIFELVLGAFFALAVWHWRRWGVYGLLSLMVFGLVRNLADNAAHALATLGGILLFVLLLIPHWEQMED